MYLRVVEWHKPHPLKKIKEISISRQNKTQSNQVGYLRINVKNP